MSRRSSVAASSRPLSAGRRGGGPDHDHRPGRKPFEVRRERCRSRRRSRFRWTAGPTLRPMVNPARAGLALESLARCTTRPAAPARRPPRTVAVKSSRRRTRRSAGSTSVPRVALRARPTARRVPCGDAMTGSSGQHGCACAAGSRASSRADGCSAGTCACSQLLPPRVQGSSTRPRHAQAAHKGRACQGTGGREARSNARPDRAAEIRPPVKPTRRSVGGQCGQAVVAAR